MQRCPLHPLVLTLNCAITLRLRRCWAMFTSSVHAVAKQLPDEGVMVLGWDKADGIVLTINVGVSKSGNRIWFGCSPNAGEYEDAKRYSDLTHWMPLPAPPEASK